MQSADTAEAALKQCIDCNCRTKSASARRTFARRPYSVCPIYMVEVGERVRPRLEGPSGLGSDIADERPKTLMMDGIIQSAD